VDDSAARAGRVKRFLLGLMVAALDLILVVALVLLTIELIRMVA
jgi:hypothetical protein